MKKEYLAPQIDIDKFDFAKSVITTSELEDGNNEVTLPGGLGRQSSFDGPEF